MQSLQSMLDRTQRQISTGKRILTPADDPIAASRTLDMRESLSRLGQFERNSNMATIRLQDEEVALKGVNDVLQRVRELTLQANNATQSNETRALIATELKENLNQLVQLANQQDAEGRYIFSGNREDTAAVVQTAAGFTFNGDDGRHESQIGENRSITTGDSGADVFYRIRAGNGTFVVKPSSGNSGSGIVTASKVVDSALYDKSGYTVRFVDEASYEVLDTSNSVVATGTHEPGQTIGFQGIEFSLDGRAAGGDEFVVAPSRYQSVFESVQQIIDAVEAPIAGDASRALSGSRLNAGLEDIDQAIGNVLEFRTSVGTRLGAIEQQSDTNDSFALNLQQTIGELEDLDYAEALSRLSFTLTVLEASQQSFVRTQGLTLFNFL
jgi:flagellar hook-associated protein 3 FlgL